MSASHSIENQSPRVSRSVRTAPAEIVRALALLLLPTLLVIGLFRGGGSHMLAPGDTAANLQLSAVDSAGTEGTMFGGKLTAILFFSAECPHCVREIVTFDRLSNRFGGTISFLAISSSNRSRTANLLREKQIAVHTALDSGDGGKRIYGVDVLPAFFLIGKDGTVLYRDSGERGYIVRERLFKRFTDEQTTFLE